MVEVVDGKAVTRNRGVEVAVSVELVDGVAVKVVVVVAVEVVVGVAVRVEVVVGGSAVGDTEATSLPTVKSTPQTWGRDRVAE
jgi:hypothetical protein